MIGQKDNVPYYTAKTAEERLGEHNKEPKLLIQAAQSKNKSDPWWHHPATRLKGLSAGVQVADIIGHPWGFYAHVL